VEAVSCKSINKAARNLYITQPALTIALNSFENEIGVKLLNRSHAGVIPTEKGKEVYEDAKQILQIIKKWDKYSAEKTIQYVNVQLISVPAIYNTIIHDVILDIAKRYPKLDIQPEEVLLHDILRLVRETEKPIVAISYVEEGKLEEIKQQCAKDGLTMNILFEDEFQVFLNAAHPLAAKKYLTKSDLKHLTLVGYIDERPIDFAMKPLFNKDWYYRLYNQESILRNICKEQNFCAMFPGILAERNFEEIKAMLIQDTTFKLYYIVVSKNKNRISKEEIQVVKSIQQFCREQYGEVEIEDAHIFDMETK